jgi:hypothetical protein
MNGTVTLLLCPLLVATMLAAPLTTSVTIGPATITLEESTFVTVAKQLGDSPLSQRGDAGESRVQTCYVTAGARPTTYFLESGEMGGGDHIVQVDVVGSRRTTAAEAPIIATRCTKLAAAIPTARTDRGLRLGLSRSDVERRLNVRGRERAGVTVYEKEEKRQDGARVFDVSSWVRVRYVGGRVAAFSVGLVSTT